MADLDLDLGALSLDELKALETDVRKAIASFEDRKRKELLERAREMAAAEGFTLADLFDTSRTGRTGKPRKPAAPRYRHPDDPDRTWSGRGRTPRWIRDAEAAGQDRETFAIG